MTPEDRLRALRDAARLNGRDQVWVLLRLLQPCRVEEILDHGNISRDTVQEYLQGLKIAGYVDVRGEVIHLVRDVGLERPMVREDGSPIPETGRQRAWRAMRILREFSVDDVVAYAGVSRVDMLDYLRGLKKMNVLVVSRESRPGMTARYRIARDPGPTAPSLSRAARKG